MTQFVQVFDTADNSCKKRALPRVTAGGGILVDKSVLPSTGATTYRVRVDPASIDALVGPATNVTPGLVALAVPNEYPALIADNTQATTPAYVNTAIGAAIDAYVPDTATNTTAGIVELATAADYPDNTNDTDATTPAYVAAAISAIPPVPDWLPQLSIATIDPANAGIGNLVDYPNTAPIPLSDFTALDAQRTAPSFDMMEAVFTNRATDAAARGFMNTNGTPGFYSKQAASLAEIVDDNGAWLGLSDATGTNIMPDGRYAGQIAFITFSGLGQVVLQGKIRGPIRDVTGERVFSAGVSPIDTYWNPTEGVTLRWSGSTWSMVGLTADIENATTVPINDLATLTNADRGLTYAPADITSVPLTLAQTTQAFAGQVPLSIQDTTALLTNRAAEPTATGVMNSNGTLGHYSRIYSGATDLATSQALVNQAVIQSNGALVRLILANNDTLVMPSPTYPGQILHLTISIASSVAEAVINFPLQTSIIGNYRRTNHSIGNGSVGAINVIVRTQETLSLVGIGNSWFITNHTTRLFSNSTFREYDDGTIDMFFAANFGNVIAAGGNAVSDIALPLIITNPTQIRTFFNDMEGGSAWTLGPGGLPTATQPLTFINNKASNTASTIRVGAFNVGSVSCDPFNIEILVKGARLNYLAYGGIASF